MISLDREKTDYLIHNFGNLSKIQILILQRDAKIIRIYKDVRGTSVTLNFSKRSVEFKVLAELIQMRVAKNQYWYEITSMDKRESTIYNRRAIKSIDWATEALNLRTTDQQISLPANLYNVAEIKKSYDWRKKNGSRSQPQTDGFTDVTTTYVNQQDKKSSGIETGTKKPAMPQIPQLQQQPPAAASATPPPYQFESASAATLLSQMRAHIAELSELIPEHNTGSQKIADMQRKMHDCLSSMKVELNLSEDLDTLLVTSDLPYDPAHCQLKNALAATLLSQMKAHIAELWELIPEYNAGSQKIADIQRKMHECMLPIKIRLNPSEDLATLLAMGDLPCPCG